MSTLPNHAKRAAEADQEAIAAHHGTAATSTKHASSLVLRGRKGRAGDIAYARYARELLRKVFQSNVDHAVGGERFAGNKRGRGGFDRAAIG